MERSLNGFFATAKIRQTLGLRANQETGHETARASDVMSTSLAGNEGS